MPLSTKEVDKSIERKIEEDTQLKRFEKTILTTFLDKVGESVDNTYTLFDYSVFLEILSKKNH